MGVILEHGDEDMNVWLRGGVENETGVAKRRTEARAISEKQSHPLVVLVKGVSNEMCMKLS